MRSHPPNGFSIIEFLVAITVTALLMAGALTVTLSSRRVYSTDRTRIQVNQNLRSALDMIGLAVRQAGERLPPDFPALELVNGTSGAPDRLILRRNLADEVLPLCSALSSGNVDTEFRVADASGPLGCQPLPDTSGDGFADNVSTWRARRTAAGGAVWSYLYNPMLGTGDWALYDSDGSGGADWVGKGNGDAWANSYSVQQSARVYLLEQRSFELAGGLLRFFQNQDTATPINLSAEIADFQVEILLTDGTVLTSMDSTVPWTSVQAVDVMIAGNRTLENGTVQRSVSARFFPRSILASP